LCIEDIPDSPPRRWVDVEQEQEDEMIAKLGLTLWGHLCQMEMEQEAEYKAKEKGVIYNESRSG